MIKLDFGCGNGGFPGGDAVHPRDRGSWLEKNGDENTIALDINQYAIAEAKRRIKNGTQFVISDGRLMPFKDGSFDYIHEWGTLHHIKDYQVAIAEIARVLKRGGVFVACETIDNDFFYALCRTIAGSWKGNRIESRFDSDRLLADLGQHFEIQKVEYWYRPLILDFPAYFFEKYPGWAFGVYFQYYGSKLRRKLKILPRFARHVTITATRP